MMGDFTLGHFRTILESIKERRFETYTFSEWFQQKPTHGVLVRHDVDRKPINSLHMARMEAELGISATYYFRIYKCSFDPTIIREIAALGHEIGYHFEALSAENGDAVRAKVHFRLGLEKIREITPVQTVAMHGSPLSNFDNRDYWRVTGDKFEDLGLLGDAFESIDYRDFNYFTDTGRTWAETKYNIRDRVRGANLSTVASSTELANFIAGTSNGKLAIVAHPERWTDNRVEWLGQWAKDSLINRIKVLRALLK